MMISFAVDCWSEEIISTSRIHMQSRSNPRYLEGGEKADGRDKPFVLGKKWNTRKGNI
jgi:hypothetical protein